MRCDPNLPGDRYTFYTQNLAGKVRYAVLTFYIVLTRKLLHIDGNNTYDYNVSLFTHIHLSCVYAVTRKHKNVRTINKKRICLPVWFSYVKNMPETYTCRTIACTDYMV